MVAQSATHQHKRLGKHQKHSRDFLKVYWPYMPLVLILSFGIIFSAFWQAKAQNNVLAYSTNMSVSGLLSATNSQRANYSKAALKLNSKLNQAAQAKANDMVAKDYWSHNTPSGDPPWIFITNAGYDYKAAGENLAYGHMTYTDTVNGWMNSSGHKANLLSSTFAEVGFGYKNSSNFNGDGQQTVVVAMYAAPRVLSSTTTSSPTTTASQPSSQAATQTKTSEQPKPKPADPQKTPEPGAFISVDGGPPTAITSSTVKTSRFSALVGDKAHWVTPIASLLIVVSIVALLARHSYAVHRWLKNGERYVLHHFVFDITIISLIGVCIVITRAAGYVL